MDWRIRCALALTLICSPLHAQTPRPFPQPGQTPAAPPAPSQPAQPARPSPAPTATPAVKPPSPSETPTEATLGVPIYPAAQFITSYDAGRGQRFFLFGAAAPYAEMVGFYRTALKQKGNELFESPPTHQFDIGRFRDETMAFPPTVTIKDYTWGGSAGYPNPKPGAQPAQFTTIIQIVPVPPGTPPGE
jgi:hypothetical protein